MHAGFERARYQAEAIKKASAPGTRPAVCADPRRVNLMSLVAKGPLFLRVGLLVRSLARSLVTVVTVGVTVGTKIRPANESRQEWIPSVTRYYLNTALPSRVLERKAPRYGYEWIRSCTLGPRCMETPGDRDYDLFVPRAHAGGKNNEASRSLWLWLLFG